MFIININLFIVPLLGARLLSFREGLRKKGELGKDIYFGKLIIISIDEANLYLIIII